MAKEKFVGTPMELVLQSLTSHCHPSQGKGYLCHKALFQRLLLLVLLIGWGAKS